MRERIMLQAYIVDIVYNDLKEYMTNLEKYRDSCMTGDAKKFYVLIKESVDVLWSQENKWDARKMEYVKRWDKVTMTPAAAQRRIRDEVRPRIVEAQGLKPEMLEEGDITLDRICRFVVLYFGEDLVLLGEKQQTRCLLDRLEQLSFDGHTGGSSCGGGCVP
jgi:hypothetical protein